MSSRRLSLLLDGAESANRVEFSGRLLALGVLRHTPAGVPVVEFKLGHQSTQEEAGGMRRVECDLACVVVGPFAGLLSTAKLGDAMFATGFLAAKSVGNRTPVLHVKEIEFQEGSENGS